MGIETKVEFMRDVEMSLMEKVTVSDMTHIMKTIMDVLEGYEINACLCRTENGKGSSFPAERAGSGKACA